MRIRAAFFLRFRVGLAVRGALAARAAPAQIPTPALPRPALPPLRAVARPRVVSFKVTDGPYLKPSSWRGRSTKIEIELADYSPPADRFFHPTLWAPGCVSGGAYPSSEPGGVPYRLRYDVDFVGVDNSGKRCAVEIHPNGLDATPSLAAGEVRLPALETYTLGDTWDLLDFRTPSGKKLAATASKGVLPCQLGSVGTAGTFATGIVKEGGDLTFQLRNGLLDEACTFTTGPALLVRDDWAVKSVQWDFTEDALCRAADKLATQASSGRTVTFFFDESAVFAVTFDALCKPNPADPPRNDHVFKARLASIKVVGPAGKTGRDAFK